MKCLLCRKQSQLVLLALLSSLSLSLILGSAVLAQTTAAKQRKAPAGTSQPATKPAVDAKKAVEPKIEMTYPPQLPGDQEVVTDTSNDFLKRPENLSGDFTVAKTAPTVDFLLFPGQDHPGKPWSDWGDGSTLGDKYYTAIGDHHAPKGTAQLYEYDASSKKLRLLVDIRKFLESTPGALPATMNYTPGKVHSRIEVGSDGAVYYSTHRGSTNVTDDAHGYLGDWIFRTDPISGKTDIAAAYPVAKHCIPASVLDAQRMIYYGGTAAGVNNKQDPSEDIQFLAYDLKNHKVLKTAPAGFDRYAIFAASTGCVYWRYEVVDDKTKKAVVSEGKKYDPATNQITDCPAVPHVRSASRETPQGIVYGTSHGDSQLWAFNTKTETVEQLGECAVGHQHYITSVDVDPSGRYLYFVAGAHGGTSSEGTPVVQYDTQTKTRKVIAFLDEYYWNKYGYRFDGTFSCALDSKGEILFVTWNGWRKPQTKGWECASMTAIHIPASERQP